MEAIWLYRYKKYNTDKEYAKEVNNSNDERSTYVKKEASFVSHFVVMLVLWIASLLFRLADNTTLSTACSLMLIGMLILFAIVEAVISKQH